MHGLARGLPLDRAGCPPGRASHRGAAWARGLACAHSCPGAGGRMSNISAGQVSMQLPSLRLLLAAICKATTNEPNHRAHRVHRGRTETFCQGHLTHYTILKVHDNHLTAAGPLVGCLGEGGLPIGPGLAPGCRSGSGARLRALASGRRRPDEQYFCWTGLNATLRLWLLLAAICKATTNESNHKDHEAHKGCTKTFCQGHLTHCLS